MGNCFSDPSKSNSKGQTLGSGPARSAPSNLSSPPQTLGAITTSQATAGPPGDAREMALRAAEERAKAAKSKGVNSTNPNAGKLSSKLENGRKKGASNGTEADERLMDRGEWN
ncbi:hypothetical protein P7C73_g471, partial [Tremellales sp. Uapishka_1]